MRVVGEALPITHAAQAARRLAAGEGFAAAAPALAAEAAVGVGYAVLAAALLKLFEAESRRRASLDTM
jgi:ABC-2 type transport system permease protein